MGEAVSDEAASAVLARLDDALDDLVALPLGSLTADDVLAIWRRMERHDRKRVCVDHALIAQVESRHLPYEHAATSTVSFARQVLRISVSEAKARVSEAQSVGPRVSLLGEQLGPIFEHVAAAQSAGDISSAHARVVVDTIEKLPGEVQHGQGAEIEAALVAEAGRTDPDTLAKTARQMQAEFDEDGRYNDPKERERRRGLRASFRPDGSCRGTFEGTAEFGEYLRTVFDSLARPVPTEGCPDQRNPGQRQHDAVLEVMAMAMRAESLPDAGGVTSTLILTTSAENWVEGKGTVTTGHGAVVPTTLAKSWTSGDAQVIAVALDRMRQIEAYSSIQRLFTKQQRLAITARDGGCIFPGCDAPPQRCETHHIIEYQHGGRTSVDNGCLLCPFHHREHEVLGWRLIVQDGVPWWIPPRFIDRDQRPVRNTLHRPSDLLLV